jgi:hypothetical protein
VPLHLMECRALGGWTPRLGFIQSGGRGRDILKQPRLSSRGKRHEKGPEHLAGGMLYDAFGVPRSSSNA